MSHGKILWIDADGKPDRRTESRPVNEVSRSFLRGRARTLKGISRLVLSRKKEEIERILLFLRQKSAFNFWWIGKT